MVAATSPAITLPLARVVELGGDPQGASPPTASGDTTRIAGDEKRRKKTLRIVSVNKEECVYVLCS